MTRHAERLVEAHLGDAAGHASDDRGRVSRHFSWRSRRTAVLAGFLMKSITVIGAVVLLSAPIAMAKERSIGVCAADIKAKCAEVKPGGGRIKDCVKTHAADFSEARVAEISKACRLM